MANETFTRVLAPRLTNALKAIELIGNLCAKRYEWTPEEILDVFQQIETTAQASLARFKDTDRWPRQASLAELREMKDTGQLYPSEPDSSPEDLGPDFWTDAEVVEPVPALGETLEDFRWIRSAHPALIEALAPFKVRLEQVADLEIRLEYALGLQATFRGELVLDNEPPPWTGKFKSHDERGNQKTSSR